MTLKTNSTICVDARITPGQMGGVEQVVLGAARGLSSLSDGDEEYVFLTADDGAWLQPYVSGPCRIHALGLAPASATRRSLRDRWPVLHRVWHQVSPLLGPRTIPVPDGAPLIASVRPDLVHFVIQTGFITAVPSIFSPFDLQHIHLPENFTPRERLARRHLYRTYAHQAQVVAASTEWGKRDMSTHLELPPDKIQVLPVGNILPYYPRTTEADREALRARLKLPARFLYFPAQTYPSKNHLGLIRALAQLRAEGLIVPVVCSGRLNEHYPAIRQAVERSGLDGQMLFTEFVTPMEVVGLYQLSAGLIFPTLFEGWGQPVIEAFWAGTPVACSSVTSLPEVAGDAALLFDPSTTTAIADAIRQLWTDQDLRQRLIARGKARADLFTWERTARLYRALYRKILQRGLTADDRALLADPLPG